VTVQRRASGALFSFLARPFGRVLRIWFMGELTEESLDECLSALRDPLSGEEPIVVLDLDGLRSIDDVGVGVLRTIRDDVEADGRRLLLTSVPATVERQLVAAGRPGFDFLDGRHGGEQCVVCDGRIPLDMHLCPHCGAAL
jgi:anti-anti-sigma factor